MKVRQTLLLNVAGWRSTATRVLSKRASIVVATDTAFSPFYGQSRPHGCLAAHHSPQAGPRLSPALRIWAIFFLRKAPKRAAASGRGERAAPTEAEALFISARPELAQVSALNLG